MPSSRFSAGEFTGEQSRQKQSLRNRNSHHASVVRDGLVLTPALFDEFVETTATRVASLLAQQPKLVDRYDLAKLLNVSVSTIERKLKDGTISAGVVRVNRRVLFAPDTVVSELATVGKGVDQ